MNEDEIYIEDDKFNSKAISFSYVRIKEILLEKEFKNT